MADIALNAIAPVSPAPQKNSQDQASQAAPSSFASVLKERSATQQAAPAAPATKSPSPNARTQAAKSEQASESADSAETAVEADAAEGTPADAMLAALLGLSTDAKDTASAPLAQADTAADAKSDASAQLIDPSLQIAAPIALPTPPASSAATPASLAAGGNTDTGQDASSLVLGDTSVPGGTSPQIATGAATKDATAVTGDTDPTQQSALTLKDNAFGDALAAAQRSAGQAVAQAQAQAASQSAPTAQATELPQHTVRTPVGSPGWADEVGQRIGWVANRDSGRAELVLTPPTMGRVEVSINMNGDQASASFVAASPAAREALQDALPRLREMLAQAGIQLTHADVGAGQQGQAQNGSQQGQGSRGSGHGLAGMQGAEGADSLAANSTLGRIQSGRGLVDIFA